MPLQKQVVPLPLTKGVDKGVANVLRSPDALEQGSNIEQLVSGELTKRNGFQSVDTGSTTMLSLFPANGSVGTIQSSKTIEVLDTQSQTLREIYSENLVRPALGQVSCKIKDMLGLAGSVYTYDSTIISDYIYVALKSSEESSIKMYKLDTNMNAIPYSSTRVYSLLGGGNPPYDYVRFAGSRLFTSVGANVGVFGVDGSTVTNNLFTPAGTNLWDVIPWSSGGFAIVFDDGANIVVRLVNSSLSTIGSTSVARTNVNSLCIFEELAGTSFYIAVTRTAGSSASIYRIGSTPTVLQTIDFAAGTYYYNCCGITSNPNIYVFFESGSSSSSATK